MSKGIASALSQRAPLSAALIGGIALALAPAAFAQQQPSPEAQRSGMDTKLATHPPRLTVTAPDNIPLDKLKLPPGFKLELWAHGMPGARMMVRGDQGTVFVGTRTINRVYAVTDKGGQRTHTILAQGLTQPNGLAFQPAGGRDADGGRFAACLGRGERRNLSRDL